MFKTNYNPPSKLSKNMFSEWMTEFKNQIFNFNINWNAIKGILLIGFTILILLGLFITIASINNSFLSTIGAILLIPFSYFCYTTSINVAIKYFMKPSTTNIGEER